MKYPISLLTQSTPTQILQQHLFSNFLVLTQDSLTRGSISLLLSGLNTEVKQACRSCNVLIDKWQHLSTNRLLWTELLSTFQQLIRDRKALSLQLPSHQHLVYLCKFCQLRNDEPQLHKTNRERRGLSKTIDVVRKSKVHKSWWW